MTNKIFEAKSNKNGQYIDSIFEVPIFSGLRSEVLEKITKMLDKSPMNRPYFVVTINTEMLVNSNQDLDYKKVLRSADLLVPDTVGLRLLGIKHIYPGRKLVEDLLLMKKYRVFYLGGFERVAEKMVQKYGGTAYENIEESKVISEINKYKPDLLLVAYGGGVKQEKWIYENLNKIKAKVVIGVGGTFDTLTGKIKLPPKWMEKMGLEWLWRLYQEPKRWRRQLKLIQFLQICGYRWISRRNS